MLLFVMFSFCRNRALSWPGLTPFTHRSEPRRDQLKAVTPYKGPPSTPHTQDTEGNAGPEDALRPRLPSQMSGNILSDSGGRVSWYPEIGRVNFSFLQPHSPASPHTHTTHHTHTAISSSGVAEDGDDSSRPRSSQTSCCKQKGNKAPPSASTADKVASFQQLTLKRKKKDN